jgi:hypothetical protein
MDLVWSPWIWPENTRWVYPYMPRHMPPPTNNSFLTNENVSQCTACACVQLSNLNTMPPMIASCFTRHLTLYWMNTMPCHCVPLPTQVTKVMTISWRTTKHTMTHLNDISGTRAAMRCQMSKKQGEDWHIELWSQLDKSPGPSKHWETDAKRKQERWEICCERSSNVTSG